MIVRSLRTKMLGVYIVLILLILGISINYIFNLFKLNKTINSLMEANYKSIVAAQGMISALDDDQAAILSYIIADEVNGIKQFVESDRNFNASYLKAQSNITEKGESDVVLKIDLSYKTYCNSFSKMQEYKKTHDILQVVKYYNTEVAKQYNDVKALAGLFLN